MPQRGKSTTATDKQKPQAGAIEKVLDPKSVSRPGTPARAWPAADKRGGGKKIESRRKVPFGPVGGSGRKTNLARSS